VITPDGKTAFVANALDDSLTVIDLQRLDAVKRIDLGGPREITKARYGERLFHSADITFQRQFSCNSCHPGRPCRRLDLRHRGGRDRRQSGRQPDAARHSGHGAVQVGRHEPQPLAPVRAHWLVFFTRIQPFNPEESVGGGHYICTIPRPPNRYRPLGAELTDAQRRGKLMFERTQTNDGRVIPQDRCVTCHFPPLYTDRNSTTWAR
jgi:cytochrome c peroxidase